MSRSRFYSEPSPGLRGNQHENGNNKNENHYKKVEYTKNHRQLRFSVINTRLFNS